MSERRPQGSGHHHWRVVQEPVGCMAGMVTGPPRYVKRFVEAAQTWAVRD